MRCSAFKGYLPLNPQHFTGKEMTPDLSFNTAMSFITNTNWQNYTPEAAVSYFSNMVALAMHNWMSAATGIAVAIAIVRGFARHSANGLGNFWVDMTRCTLYVLLPICLVYALVLVWQGVPQNFAPYTQATTLEGAEQTIAQGPVASQEGIKMLGTNGGGFFNANSAHPYENPTPLTNLLEMLSIFLIPAGLTYTFGKMVGNTKQGWALFAAMAFMFVGGLGVCYWAEAKGNPNVAQLGVMTAATAGQPGGNMEGKETRFGIAAFRAVRDRDDRRLLRRRQLHARQLHAARRGGPAGQHHVRRDDLRRRRRRPIRNADVRRGRRLHRRPDGRAHAGVHRQEDREVRGAHGDPGRAHPVRERRCVDRLRRPTSTCHRARIPSPSRTNRRRTKRSCWRSIPLPPGTTSTTAAPPSTTAPPRTTSTTPARTASPRSSMHTLPRRATTAPPSPASRATRRTTT